MSQEAALVVTDRRATALDATEPPAREELRTLTLREGLMLLPVEAQQVQLAEYEARRGVFLRWLRAHFQEGTHYGYPPGCRPRPTKAEEWTAQPTLYKRGAEVVIDLLRLYPRYAVDLELLSQLAAPKGTIAFRCELLDETQARVLGVGHGVVEAGEKQHGANARTKVAKKRAKVDAVLTAIPILGELFTQDAEDNPPDTEPARRREQAQRDAKRQTGSQRRRVGKPEGELTEPQIKRLESLAGDDRLEAKQQDWASRWLAWLREGKHENPRAKANEVILRLKSAIAPPDGARYVPAEELVDDDREPDAGEPPEDAPPTPPLEGGDGFDDPIDDLYREGDDREPGEEG